MVKIKYFVFVGILTMLVFISLIIPTLISVQIVFGIHSRAVVNAVGKAIVNILNLLKFTLDTTNESLLMILFVDTILLCACSYLNLNIIRPIFIMIITNIKRFKSNEIEFKNMLYNIFKLLYPSIAILLLK